MEHISLDEEDFRCLVRGGIVHFDERISLRICLQDIGYSTMLDAITDAETGVEETFKDHIKVKQ